MLTYLTAITILICTGHEEHTLQVYVLRGPTTFVISNDLQSAVMQVRVSSTNLLGDMFLEQINTQINKTVYRELGRGVPHDVIPFFEQL